MEQQQKVFIVSTAPHVHGKDTTASLMLDVIAALIPCVVAGIWLFGWAAARTVLLSTVACVVCELAIQMITKRPIRINDLSAVVTGIILGLNLPSTAPWWMVLVGAVFAIGLVKQIFGGIGDNFVNPALAARAALLASWPALMSGAAFVTPFDGVSSATPLAADAVSGATPMAAGPEPANILDLLVGRIPGSIGEVCKIAILIGLIYLLIKGTITWHIPVSMLGTFMLCSQLFGNDPITAVFTGSVLFGAVFMATDYVTSPMTNGGKLIYGAGAGLIIALIRAFGSYPEGTTYGILMMNVATPLIDKLVKRKIYGEVKA